MITILSLFDYTGNWSKPYRDAGYDVIQVDIKHGQNVYLIDPAEYPFIHGILAAPPCTDFAGSGARWWADKDEDDRMFESLYKTLSVIWYLKHRDGCWWCLENPVGRLNSMVPALADYGPWYFQPCDYGDPYTKKTGLWGEFVAPLPLFVGEVRAVEAVEGSRMHRLPPSSERAALRSMTPPGFARAFFEVNP